MYGLSCFIQGCFKKYTLEVTFKLYAAWKRPKTVLLLLYSKAIRTILFSFLSIQISKWTHPWFVLSGEKKRVQTHWTFSIWTDLFPFLRTLCTTMFVCTGRPLLDIVHSLTCTFTGSIVPSMNSRLQPTAVIIIQEQTTN